MGPVSTSPRSVFVKISDVDRRKMTEALTPDEVRKVERSIDKFNKSVQTEIDAKEGRIRSGPGREIKDFYNPALTAPRVSEAAESAKRLEAFYAAGDRTKETMTPDEISQWVASLTDRNLTSINLLASTPNLDDRSGNVLIDKGNLLSTTV